MNLVDENKKEERMKICRDCEFFLLNVCKKCGCFMPAKTKFQTSRCPIGKWGPSE
jgi:hypothetical protein